MNQSYIGPMTHIKAGLLTGLNGLKTGCSLGLLPGDSSALRL